MAGGRCTQGREREEGPVSALGEELAHVLREVAAGEVQAQDRVRQRVALRKARSRKEVGERMRKQEGR